MNTLISKSIHQEKSLKLGHKRNISLLIEISNFSRSVLCYLVIHRTDADKHAVIIDEILNNYHDNKARHVYHRITILLHNRGIKLTIKPYKGLTSAKHRYQAFIVAKLLILHNFYLNIVSNFLRLLHFGCCF